MIKVIDQFTFNYYAKPYEFAPKIKECKQKALELAREKCYEGYILEPYCKHNKNGEGWDVEFIVRVLEHIKD